MNRLNKLLNACNHTGHRKEREGGIEKREMVTTNKRKVARCDRQTLGHIFFSDLRNGVIEQRKKY